MQLVCVNTITPENRELYPTFLQTLDVKQARYWEK